MQKKNKKEWISNLILRDDVIDVFVLNVSQETWEIKIQIGCDDED